LSPSDLDCILSMIRASQHNMPSHICVIILMTACAKWPQASKSWAVTVCQNRASGAWEHWGSAVCQGWGTTAVGILGRFSFYLWYQIWQPMFGRLWVPVLSQFCRPELGCNCFTMLGQNCLPGSGQWCLRALSQCCLPRLGHHCRRDTGTIFILPLVPDLATNVRPTLGTSSEPVLRQLSMLSGRAIYWNSSNFIDWCCMW